MQAYSNRYDQALTLAASAHRHQMRKGSDTPYIAHPVHVSIILIRHGFSEDVAIAGLLHDVVEDQDLSLAEIRAGFGPAVAEMVAALTEEKEEAGQKRPWEIRKQEALAHAQTASTKAVAVKAADTLHNTRTLTRQIEEQGAATWQNYARGPEQSLWYVRSVAAIAAQRLGEHPLAQELEQAVITLEQAIAAAEAK